MGRRDPLRRRRLVVGSVLGACVVTAMIAVSFTGAAPTPIEAEEPAVEVELLPPEEEKPEPEPVIVDPAPKNTMAAVTRSAPSIETPVEVPDEPAPESDPHEGPSGGGDPYARRGSGSGEGSGTALGAPPPPLPPPAPPLPLPASKPKKKGPMRITEDMTPPKPLAQPAPSYPAGAKAAGIEGTVVVRYVISESGRVTAASVVRGPSELAGVCLVAVKSWTFEPARDASGRAVSVHRVARFPFRITT